MPICNLFGERADWGACWGIRISPYEICVGRGPGVIEVIEDLESKTEFKSSYFITVNLVVIYLVCQFLSIKVI